MSFSPANSVLWTEIPVNDMDKAIAFYQAVFDYDLSVEARGRNPMALIPSDDAPKNGFGRLFPGKFGHLYPGKGAGEGQGPTLHMAVPGTVEDAIERCEQAGGKILSQIIPSPSGRFAYALDLDGNSIGLFEPAV